MAPKPKPPIVRWLPKVNKAEGPKGCWRWTASIDSTTGYGKFNYNGETRPAHRFSYEHYRGSIPDGYVLDHRCKNRWCVNPWHLEPETLRNNLILDGTDYIGSFNRSKTHCKRGHPLSGDNLWVSKAGARHCKICNAGRMRERRRFQRTI